MATTKKKKEVVAPVVRDPKLSWWDKLLVDLGSANNVKK